MKRLIASMILISVSITALAENPPAKDFSVKGDVTQAQTINLCIDYHSQQDAKKKQAELNELKRRGMLSVKDLDLLSGKGPTKEIESGVTRCGMYMLRGIPLHEKGKFIEHKWVRTPKIVHVYPDKYYVSQSGIITQVYDRKPGQLPPELDPKAPETAPPPVLMEAVPGHSTQPDNKGAH